MEIGGDMISTARIDFEPGHEQHQNMVEATNSRSTNKLPMTDPIEALYETQVIRYKGRAY